MIFKINIPEDCGNAPKKKVLVAFITALCGSDLTALHSLLDDRFQLDEVGIASFRDEAFERWHAHFIHPPIQAIDVKAVLTHGRQGVIEGIFTRIDGNRYRFCALCTFTSSLRMAKIGAVTWYLLDLSREKNSSISHSIKQAKQ